MTARPVPPAQKGLLLAVVQWLIALGATLGYLAMIVPDYGYAPAWPLNVGFGLFLLLLFVVAFRGTDRIAKPLTAIGVVAFGMIIAGHLRMEKALAELRAEINEMKQQRLAIGPDQYLHDGDPFGKEYEKAFGNYERLNRERVYKQESREKEVLGNPDLFPAMAKLIEDKRPGWPRVLFEFSRRGFFERSPGEMRQGYEGEIQVGCGHYFSTPLGLTHYNSHLAYRNAEKRTMAHAERDRESFLKAWQERPKENP
jgi:hypothetical protein